MTHMNKYKIGFFIIVGIIICLIFVTIPMLSAQAAFGLPSLLDTSWAFDYAVICLPDRC